MKRKSTCLLIFVAAIAAALLMACSAEERPGSVKETDAETQAEAVEPDPVPAAVTFDLKQGGVSFDLPEKLQHLKGVIQPGYGQEIERGSGIFISALTYCAMTEEKYSELVAKGPGLTQEDMDFTAPRLIDMVHIFAIDGERSLEDLDRELQRYGLSADGFRGLGSAGEYNFFYMADPYADILDEQFVFDEGFREEYDGLIPAFDDPSWIRIYEPQGTAAASAGTAVRFETVDLNGSPVSSEEIFSQHTLTMVNIWGTYCGPCIREMPDLEVLSQRLKEKDCAIIGIVCDVRGTNDTEVIKSAEEIIAQTGVTYLNLIPWDTLWETLPSEYIPTTYFVDSEGNIVGEAAVGARGADDYEALIDALLKDKAD
ncbi:MAG: TlpA family protein disulfide reductase [Lachnospiraceae bacterium]|nr:TlpA family protein disulfide reductase [Lachnospiraceae bacterium]